MSIAIAAWAGATGADNLIAKAFTGTPLLMIGMGALAGGISPFCSCGVIPLIAALLAMGVPLSAVMAFWLASPIMDPSMFVLTAGMISLEFATAKTIAAVGLGVFGGTIVHVLMKNGAFSDPLREGFGNGGCGGAKIRTPKPVMWRFWTEAERRASFGNTALTTTLFLAKWLTLAFILESLMLAWVPAETVTAMIGGESLMPISQQLWWVFRPFKMAMLPYLWLEGFSTKAWHRVRLWLFLLREASPQSQLQWQSGR